MEINGKQINDLVIHIYLKLLAPKLWGVSPDKGWTRPLVIDYNGEWYIMSKEDNEYFPREYFDYTKDVENGLYVPTGIKVGEK